MLKHPFYMRTKRLQPPAEYLAVSVVVRYTQFEIFVPRLGVEVQLGAFFVAELISGRRKNTGKLVLRHRKVVFLHFAFPVLDIPIFYKKMHKILDIYASSLQIAYIPPYVFEALQYFGERNAFYG